MLDCIHICVFPFLKNGFKQSRHLLDTWLFVELLRSFLIAISTDSRQLVDRLSFSSCVFALFLDTFSTAVSVDVVFLDTYLDRWLDTSIYRELLKRYILGCRDPILIFFDLSRSIRTCSSHKHLLSHSKPLPKWFFMLFQVFLYLVSF